MIADGIDQAKFRTPRHLVKSKGFEKVMRPALHVHGVWVHGHCFHMAVSNPDVKKDSATNIEAMARALEQLYARVMSLPPTAQTYSHSHSHSHNSQQHVLTCVPPWPQTPQA